MNYVVWSMSHPAAQLWFIFEPQIVTSTLDSLANELCLSCLTSVGVVVRSVTAA